MASPTVNPINLYAYFETLSVKHLQRTKTFLEELIKNKTTEDCNAISELDINDFISYHKNFINDTECETILNNFRHISKFNQNSDTSSNTKSLWLSRTDEPYDWSSKKSGKTTHNKALPITDFPRVNELLDKVNQELGSDLNSCLIAYYPDGTSGIRLHDDFEHTLDNDQPIAVVSIGAKRPVEFFHNHQAPTESPVSSIEVESSSMYVMKAKCQEFFRHRVPAVGNCYIERFSLSFRKIMTKSDNASEILPKVKVGYLLGAQSKMSDASTSPVKYNVAMFENLAKSSTSNGFPNNRPEPPTMITPSAPPANKVNSAVPTFEPAIASAPIYDNRNVTLLLGTSMTRWVKPEILSDSFTEFVNVSHSGACIKNARPGHRIPDMGEMVQKFAATNVDKVPRVKHVIVSVGTNDIKHYRTDNGQGKTATPGDMRRFHKPLSNLVKSIRYHFGSDVRISFQSVLPMRLMYSYTATNFLNFNLLLNSICSEMGCYYLDWFHMFLDGQKFDHNRELFSDPFHLNRRGYDLVHKCFKRALQYDGCFSH